MVGWMRQPETFAKPKMKPKTVKFPSFPRRRESCLILKIISKTIRYLSLTKIPAYAGMTAFLVFQAASEVLQRSQPV